MRSKLVAISPYLVTIPAISSYNANGASHTVNYAAISTEPGAAMDNPIVVGSDGLLALTFWRPQRQGLGGADGTDYVDVGHLRYGIVFIGPVGGGGGGPGEQACSGLYSLPSATFSDHSLPTPDNDFWPLQDSADDSAPAASNTVSFTVDARTCITRAGYGPGSYILSLQAAGPDVHGSNRSGQDFVISIP